jgi:hypothetical protein
VGRREVRSAICGFYVRQSRIHARLRCESDGSLQWFNFWHLPGSNSGLFPKPPAQSRARTALLRVV